MTPTSCGANYFSLPGSRKSPCHREAKAVAMGPFSGTDCAIGFTKLVVWCRKDADTRRSSVYNRSAQESETMHLLRCGGVSGNLTVGILATRIRAQFGIRIATR